MKNNNKSNDKMYLDLSKLPELTYLSIRANGLVELPASIESLNNLEILAAGDNKINSFSINVDRMNALKKKRR